MPNMLKSACCELTAKCMVEGCAAPSSKAPLSSIRPSPLPDVEEGGETVFKREGFEGAGKPIDDWRSCEPGAFKVRAAPAFARHPAQPPPRARPGPPRAYLPPRRQPTGLPDPKAHSRLLRGALTLILYNNSTKTAIPLAAPGEAAQGRRGAVLLADARPQDRRPLAARRVPRRRQLDEMGGCQVVGGRRASEAGLRGRSAASTPSRRGCKHICCMPGAYVAPST